MDSSSAFIKPASPALSNTLCLRSITSKLSDSFIPLQIWRSVSQSRPASCKYKPRKDTYYRSNSPIAFAPYMLIFSYPRCNSWIEFAPWSAIAWQINSSWLCLILHFERLIDTKEPEPRMHSARISVYLSVKWLCLITSDFMLQDSFSSNVLISVSLISFAWYLSIRISVGWDEGKSSLYRFLSSISRSLTLYEYIIIILD